MRRINISTMCCMAVALMFAASCNINGHGTTPADTMKVPYGSLIQKPDDPAADGFVFSGWYTESECLPENVWHFDSDKVYRDLTLYAKWDDTNSFD